MLRHRSALMTAALIAAAGVDFAGPEPRTVVPPTPKSPERLTKAEKKRARKAAQRLKLAQGKGESR